MVTIFCKLERIGGYSGKRVQIRRVDFAFDYTSNFYSSQGIGYHIKFEDKCDILKVKDEIIDLDRFMEIIKEQSHIYGSSNYTDNDTIILLEYEKGEVKQFGLIKMKEVLKHVLKKNHKKFEKIDLRNGNYPFTVNGLYATII